MRSTLKLAMKSMGDLLSIVLFPEPDSSLNLDATADPLGRGSLSKRPSGSCPSQQALDHFPGTLQALSAELGGIRLVLALTVLAVRDAIFDPPPLDTGNPMTSPTPHAHLHGIITGSGGRVEGEPALEKRVEKDTQRPGVSSAAIVGLAHDDFRGGIVVRAASCFELFVIGDTAGKTEIGEGDD